MPAVVGVLIYGGRMKVSIAEVNGWDTGEFVARFGAVFEDSVWVAEAAWDRRPFRDREALHAAMCAVVQEAGEERQVALIRSHPDLVGKAAREGRLGTASASEQGGAGLDRLDEEEARWFERYNRAYREKFGFPFIICVRAAARKRAIMDGFERRLDHRPEQERKAALVEIEKIAGFRLADLVEG